MMQACGRGEELRKQGALDIDTPHTVAVTATVTVVPVPMDEKCKAPKLSNSNAQRTSGDDNMKDFDWARELMDSLRFFRFPWNWAKLDKGSRKDLETSLANENRTFHSEAVAKIEGEHVTERKETNAVEVNKSPSCVNKEHEATEKETAELKSHTRKKVHDHVGLASSEKKDSNGNSNSNSNSNDEQPVAILLPMVVPSKTGNEMRLDHFAMEHEICDIQWRCSNTPTQRKSKSGRVPSVSRDKLKNLDTTTTNTSGMKNKIWKYLLILIPVSMAIFGIAATLFPSTVISELSLSQDRVRPLEHEIGERDSALDQWKEEAISCQEEIIVNNIEISTLKNEADDREIRISALEEENASIEVLERQMEKFKGEIVSYKQKIRMNKIRISALEGKFKAQRQQLKGKGGGAGAGGGGGGARGTSANADDLSVLPDSKAGSCHSDDSGNFTDDLELRTDVAHQILASSAFGMTKIEAEAVHRAKSGGGDHDDDESMMNEDDHALFVNFGNLEREDGREDEIKEDYDLLNSMKKSEGKKRKMTTKDGAKSQSGIASGGANAQGKKPVKKTKPSSKKDGIKSPNKKSGGGGTTPKSYTKKKASSVVLPIQCAPPKPRIMMMHPKRYSRRRLQRRVLQMMKRNSLPRRKPNMGSKSTLLERKRLLIEPVS